MSKSSAPDQVMQLVEEDAIATIWLARPDQLNTFREEDYVRLLELLGEVGASRRIRALVITARGRAFSAGQDLKQLNIEDKPALAEEVRQLERFQDITRKLIALDIPTITAFNGFAVGVGLEIAIACDFRITVPEAFFMFAEAKRGLFPTNGVLWLLPRLVGPANAREMLLSAGRFDSQYAYRTGLVSEIVPADQILSRAHTIAAGLANNSGDTIRGIKSLLRETFDMSLEDMMHLEIQQNIRVMNGSDFAEGISAFLEKRPPVFNPA